MSSSESIPNLVDRDFEDDENLGESEDDVENDKGYELLKKLVHLSNFLFNEDAYENIEKDADIEIVLNVAKKTPDKNSEAIAGLWKSSNPDDLQLREIFEFNEFFNHANSDTVMPAKDTLSVKVLRIVGIYIEKKSCRKIYQIMLRGKLSDIKILTMDLMTLSIIKHIRILNIMPCSPKTLIYNILQKEPEMGKSTNICYAHAIATVLYLTSKRIIGYEPCRKQYDVANNSNLTFALIYNSIVHKYGREAISRQVLNHFCLIFRFRFKEVNEEQAREALKANRILLARFQLDNSQWKKFNEFFNHAKSDTIMTAKDMIETRDKNQVIGHAVALIDAAAGGPLEFFNSWGIKWGNGGFFKTANSKVLNMTMYDVYFMEEDLVENEKDAFNKRMCTLKCDIILALNRNLLIESPAQTADDVSIDDCDDDEEVAIQLDLGLEVNKQLTGSTSTEFHEFTVLSEFDNCLRMVNTHDGLAELLPRINENAAVRNKPPASIKEQLKKDKNLNFKKCLEQFKFKNLVEIARHYDVPLSSNNFVKTVTELVEHLGKSNDITRTIKSYVRYFKTAQMVETPILQRILDPLTRNGLLDYAKKEGLAQRGPAILTTKKSLKNKIVRMGVEKKLRFVAYLEDIKLMKAEIKQHYINTKQSPESLASTILSSILTDEDIQSQPIEKDLINRPADKIKSKREQVQEKLDGCEREELENAMLYLLGIQVPKCCQNKDIFQFLLKYPLYSYVFFFADREFYKMEN